MDLFSQTTPSFSTTNILFLLLLLLSSNLLTFFLSSSLSSSSSCSFKPIPTTTTTTSTPEDLPDDATNLSPTTTNLPPEFLAFTSPQKLPLGYNPNFDSDTMYPSVGRPCTLFPTDLHRYMSYTINGSCPDDELLAQKLLLKGCEPLPRRRCRPAAPPDYVEPFPLPTSLWSTPSDSSVVWTAYKCKNYSCLINRKRNQKGFDDCKDCFDLNTREKHRWTVPNSGADSISPLTRYLQ